MSKYPRIEELGLKVLVADLLHTWCSTRADAVYASDLEALLEKGVRVFNDGKRTDEYWDNAKYYDNKFTGLVIGLQPIKKLEKVTKEEVVKELLKLCETIGCDFDQTHELIERIEKAGIAGAE